MTLGILFVISLTPRGQRRQSRSSRTLEISRKYSRAVSVPKIGMYFRERGTYFYYQASTAIISQHSKQFASEHSRT
jgi:hypothetical protein